MTMTASTQRINENLRRYLNTTPIKCVAKFVERERGVVVCPSDQVDFGSVADALEYIGDGAQLCLVEVTDRHTILYVNADNGYEFSLVLPAGASAYWLGRADRILVPITDDGLCRAFAFDDARNAT
jgi:hypothetical protein